MIVCGVPRVSDRAGVLTAPGLRIAAALEALDRAVRVVAFLPAREDVARVPVGSVVVGYEPVELEGYWRGEGTTPHDWSRYLDALRAAVLQDSWVVLSGGLPRGVALYTYQELIPELRRAGVKVAVALKGEVLGATLVADPDLVVLGAAEAQVSVGESVADVAQAQSAAALFRADRDMAVLIVGDGWVGAIDAGGVRRSFGTQASIESVVAMALSGDASAGDPWHLFPGAAA